MSIASTFQRNPMMIANNPFKIYNQLQIPKYDTQICKTKLNAFAIHQIKNKEKHLVVERCVIDSIGTFVMEQ